MSEEDRFCKQLRAAIQNTQNPEHLISILRHKLQQPKLGDSKNKKLQRQLDDFLIKLTYMQPRKTANQKV